ncbi:glycosyltransferase family 4 protein [Nesterenkonia sp. LB17]|uniref:glycosyltransferase family 4 protein n=1 Tax=unclassified Nesterenkonia TaxID=2629769 RepID=UPI001F4D2FE0|nr:MULTISPECIES: glycosyltransferase family 4 protein [unclassified Nesterenkonia]MCH8564497.1 glycosyltransferase family 4 protein [Nesterenkonia sp. LB17]MCH8570123.1 glycosyltransferase family 4 protein [Nesterenkonia sp. AY15]
MRIGYLLADPGIGLFGSKGASVHAQEMIRAFRTLGHEVTVFCTKRGDKHDDPTTVSVPADLADLPVFVVPISGSEGAAAREVAVGRNAARMADLAVEGDFDLLYERYSLFSTAGVEARGRSTARLVVEVNAPLLTEQQRHRSLHDVASAERSTRETFAQADLLSCVSAPVADWARGMLSAEPHEGAPPVRVTPNGVDPARFSARRPDLRRTDAGTTQQDTVTIGFLGTLKPWHGTDLLLRAFAQVLERRRSQALGADAPQPDLRLQIIGGGPERERLESLCAELGIGERVEFSGSVAPARVPRLLSGLDIATAPYPATSTRDEHYFSPLKVYEYLAAGVPVIASALGELTRLLEGGSAGACGETVPPGDPDGLAQALIRLVEDPARRARMGTAGRSLVEDEHSWVQRAQDLLAELPALEVTKR